MQIYVPRKRIYKRLLHLFFNLPLRLDHLRIFFHKWMLGVDAKSFKNFSFGNMWFVGHRILYPILTQKGHRVPMLGAAPGCFWLCGRVSWRCCYAVAFLIFPQAVTENPYTARAGAVGLQRAAPDQFPHKASVAIQNLSHAINAKAWPWPVEMRFGNISDRPDGHGAINSDMSYRH
jgi:hypothetical protein